MCGASLYFLNGASPKSTLSELLGTPRSATHRLTRKGALKKICLEILERLNPKALITIPAAMAAEEGILTRKEVGDVLPKLPARKVRDILANEINTENLSDEDFRELSSSIVTAYADALTSKTEGWGERNQIQRQAATTTEKLLDSVWRRLDDAVKNIMDSAPPIE